MWIVSLALRRPYTFVVMGLLMVALGVFAIMTTPTDIFPEIEIPVVSLIWNYAGLSVEEMAARITTYSEYPISGAVSDVRTIESHTYQGVSVIKIYFQPNVDVAAALAQVTAVSQTILRVMPPGAVPPLIVQYNASSVPIIQLALSSRRERSRPAAESADHAERTASTPRSRTAAMTASAGSPASRAAPRPAAGSRPPSSACCHPAPRV
jgi:multidrug efflux pump subunit AcrB